MKVIPTKKIIPTLYEFFPEKLFNISIKDKYFIIISNHDLTLCAKFYLEKGVVYKKTGAIYLIEPE